MKTALVSVALALAFVGCASDPKEDAEKERERSREEIRQMLEEVIAAMKDNKPEVYHARLCRAEREAYPLEEMRKNWNESREENAQAAASMQVKSVAPDQSNPNIATVLLSVPSDPRGNVMREAIREDGVWRIRNFPAK